MIIYVVIFSFVLLVAVQLFWSVQISEIKNRTHRDVKENLSQVMETFKYTVRPADAINSDLSVFDAHPGVLSFTDTDTIVIDTYTKEVTVGGQTVTIRKLRFANGDSPAVDLTSDTVDVTNFELSELTQADEPQTILVRLTVEAVNPGGDPNYDASISGETAVTIRSEL